jgi:hypothetical protein
VFPEVLQLGLSGAHVPPLQIPLQHSLSPLHAALSDVHWSPAHPPLTHENEQQSGPA